MHTLYTSTIPWIVVISILASIFASFAAFSFAERVAVSKGKSHWFWLASGALAMGLGVWSMHYLGMLSVRLPIEVSYHIPTVILSLLLAVLASAVALSVVSHERLSTFDSIGGAVLMGAGIGGMHYTGMHAMRCSAMHHYDPRLVALSIVVAVVFSWMALQIAFKMRKRPEQREWLRLGGAVLMGSGIAAMHYTAMAAVTFQMSDMPYSTENTVRVSTIGVVGVAFTIAIVLFGALLTALLDRRGYEQLRKVLDQLSEERDRFHAAAESGLDALYICTALRAADGTIEDFVFSYLNTNVARMEETPLNELIGRRMCQTLPRNMALGLFERYRQVVLTGKPFSDELCLYPERDLGQWIRVQAVKVRDGVAITISDITARKRSEEQILHLAHHDPLTGVLNRSLLHDRIHQAIEFAKRNQCRVGIFLIDLDGFKKINDTFGHAAGDGVLTIVANRMKDSIRATDSIVRMGGDEFVIVLTDLRNYADAPRFGEMLVHKLREPMTIDGRPLRATISVGGAVYPDSAAIADTLLLQADIALYQAKERGRNQFCVAEISSPVEAAARTREQVAERS
jgi:diguanylate cyclase (GGDEF)-like protein